MPRKKNGLENYLIDDFEKLFEEDNNYAGDDDNIVERTANIWRELLLISGEDGFEGTTSLMVDTFRKSVWAAMTGHLDMSDYRIVWQYDPETNDTSIYNYLESPTDED